MANTRKAKMSREEILEQAARLVGQTINPEEMGLKAEDIDLEQFVKLFIEKGGEKLKEKERILLGIGTYLNREGTLFTEDLKPIIDFIEGKMQIKFYFFNGILVYLSENEIDVGWIPDRPF